MILQSISIRYFAKLGILLNLPLALKNINSDKIHLKLQNHTNLRLSWDTNLLPIKFYCDLSQAVLNIGSVNTKRR